MAEIPGLGGTIKKPYQRDAIPNAQRERPIRYSASARAKRKRAESVLPVFARSSNARFSGMVEAAFDAGIKRMQSRMAMLVYAYVSFPTGTVG